MVADGLLAVGAGILLATDSDYGEINVRSSSGERGAQANEAIMKLAKPSRMICGVDCRAKDTFNQTNQVKMKHIMWRGDGGISVQYRRLYFDEPAELFGIGPDAPARPQVLSRRSCINERTIDSMQG